MTDLSTYKDTEFSRTVDHYFYTGQIRKCQMQFGAIFSELQVAVGKNDYVQQTNLMTVPVKIGSMDRVVASIMAGNTQNKPIRAPMIAVNMLGIEPAYDFVKGSNTISRETVFPLGSALPNGGKVVYKTMPFPYMLTMEAAIVATNEYQHQQMLEQILLLFNPDLQLQLSDGYDDWTKITHVTLQAVGLETPYPSEADRRIISTTLTFTVLCYLSPPVNVKENYIKKIKLRISELSRTGSFETFKIDEIPGAEGEYETIIDAAKLDMPPD